MEQVINTIGRRKTAVARIYMKPGSGKITVNNRDYKEVDPEEYIQMITPRGLKVPDAVKNYLHYKKR